MADSKISALPASTTPLAGTEVLPIVQNGVTKNVSIANLTAGRAVASAGGTFTDNQIQGTAAKGINFTANTPAAGMTSQLLNWYEDGTFTPVVTFSTPGDLSVTYSVQVGSYTRIGNKVFINFNISTSAFTFTTASGTLQITGLPFTSKNLTNNICVGSMFFGGITATGYTQIVPRCAANNSFLTLHASGSAVAPALVNSTNTPTGGSVVLRGSIAYDV